jgi:uncharacterized protein (TIGR00297 family)
MALFSIEYGSVIILLLLLIMAIVSVKKEKLTVPAAMVAVLVGIVVFAGAGYIGFILLGVFFVLGVLATSHKKELKANLHSGAAHTQRRNAGQVLANGGVAALCAAGALVDPENAAVYSMMLAASLASAAADTLSSELGMVYGRNTFNILTFKKEPAGLDGVISWEGSLIGAAGSLAVAAIWSLDAGFGKGTFLVGLAGVVGNLFDSLLGALLERKKYIGNDLVNFCNTLFAAFTAWLLWQL